MAAICTQLREVGLADRRVVVDALKMRLVPPADELDIGRPACLSGLEASASGRPAWASRSPPRPAARTRPSPPSGSTPDPWRPAAWRQSPDQRRAAGAPRGSRPSGSRGFSAQRRTHSTSLTCAASRNFSPPNLTNGMSRRVSSSSSVRAVARAAKQHGLRLERDPRFPMLENALGDAARLVDLVAHGHELRLFRRHRARSTGSWRSARAPGRSRRSTRRESVASTGSCAPA